MHRVLILLILFVKVNGNCQDFTEWFNENDPSKTNGHEVERFSIIRSKYPSKFEFTRWTGLFEVRPTPEKNYTDPQYQYIDSFTRINDGILCHAPMGKHCIDHQIRFCIEYNQCGITRYQPIDNRIVGGIEARPHSFPWLVSIQTDNQHICGGTLIDNQHILTAAHCFERTFEAKSYKIVLGAHKLSEANVSIGVKSLISHVDFNEVTYENDIGLMKLEKPIDSFSDTIQPACVTRSLKKSDQSKLYLVAGWGVTRYSQFGGRPSNELRQIYIHPMMQCSSVYERFDMRKQICAGVDNFSQDSCQGDSGGGLLEKENPLSNQWVVTGIVSHGRQCALKNYPGVYVRVGAYRDWIEWAIGELEMQ